MPTYVYEVIANDTEQTPRQFELVQKMSEEALTHDPQTGEPVRRVISAGALKFRGLKRTTVVNKKSPAATACGCATGKHHCH